MAAATATDPRFAAMMELERRGKITPDLQSQLDIARQQGVVKTGKALTEGEAKAANFYGRALGAETDFGASGYADKPRSLLGAGAAAILPTPLMNGLDGSGRQTSEQAKKDFISASLRLESGATINPDEFARQNEIFFPQPNDTPEVIAQKAAARKRVTDGFRIGAGPGASSVERQAEENAKAKAAKAAGDNEGPLGPGDIGFNTPDSGASMRQLSAEDRAAYIDLAKSGAPPEKMIEFFRSRGLELKNAGDIAAARDKGAGVNTDVEVKRRDVDLGDGTTGAFARGFADVPTLGFLDEAGGVVDTLGLTNGRENIWNSRRPIGDILGGNIDENRSIIRGDEKNHGTARTLGQLAGAVVPAPFMAARGGMGAVETGATLGTAYGVGSGETLADRFRGGLSGGAASAAGGLVLGKLSDYIGGRIAQRAQRPPAANPALDDGIATARAAEAEGVPISRPMVDPDTRDKMAYLDSSFGSGVPVREGLAATGRGIERRAESLAGGGTAQEGGMLGSTVQDAGQRFIDRSRSVGTRLYDRAANLAGANSVKASDAVAKIDQHIAELSENANANGPQISYLREIRADLANDAGALPKSVAAIRDMRTGLRGQINNRNLTATDAERRVGEVLDAARGDVTRELGESAPEAVRAYDRADKFWGERSDEIRQVVQRFIGKKDDKLSGEQVFQRVMSMAKPTGDSVRLRRMIDKLDADERGDLAATIASGLGRKSADEDFSPAVFINKARAISPAARRTVFGQDGAQSIENLVQLSKSLKDTTARLNNSRSGMVANWRDTLKNVFAAGAPTGVGYITGGAPGGVAGAAFGAGWAGAGIAIRNLSAKALMNPDMSRWLKNAVAQRDGTMINNYIARLGKIAKSNAPIRAEVALLQEKLLAAANDNTWRSAVASEPGQGENKDR